MLRYVYRLQKRYTRIFLDIHIDIGILLKILIINIRWDRLRLPSDTGLPPNHVQKPKDWGSVQTYNAMNCTGFQRERPEPVFPVQPLG